MREALQDAARGALVLVVVLAGACGSGSAAKDASVDSVAINVGGATGQADAGAADGSGAAGSGRDGSGGGGGAGGAAGVAIVLDRALADAAVPLGGASLDTFDTEVDFGFEPYHDTAQTNLADPAVIDAGTAPTLVFDPEQGSPSPGSMKVTVPFTGANQYVEVQSYVFVVPQDWSGHALHARLKVDAGSTFHGYALLYVNTGVSYIAGATAITLAAGADWQEIAMSVDHPMTVANVDRYSAKQVVLYGIQLNTGAAGDGAGPVTFHVDSFSLE